MIKSKKYISHRTKIKLQKLADEMTTTPVNLSTTVDTHTITVISLAEVVYH